MDTYGDDDGTEIEVELKKEHIDLGTFLEKRISEIYINLESAGDLSLEISTETKSQKYMLSNGYPDLHTLEFHPGKGLSGKFLDVDIKNLSGSTLSINEIEFLIDVLTRRAHNE